MGLRFKASSSQYLSASSPTITSYPFSVGMWVQLAAAGEVARTLWCLSDTGTTNNYFEIGMNSSERITLSALAGGTAATATAGITITAGGWVFILGRFITATSRRLHVFVMGGSALITTDGNTTSRSPTGIDTITLGALNTSGGTSQFWDGLIAEYWLVNGDVQPIDTTIASFHMTKLATGGPTFAGGVSVMDWLTLRKGFPSADGGDVITPGGHVWAASGSPTLGEHPPLPYWYKRPNQTIRNLMV